MRAPVHCLLKPHAGCVSAGETWPSGWGMLLQPVINQTTVASGIIVPCLPLRVARLISPGETRVSFNITKHNADRTSEKLWGSSVCAAATGCHEKKAHCWQQNAIIKKKKKLIVSRKMIFLIWFSKTMFCKKEAKATRRRMERVPRCRMRGWMFSIYSRWFPVSPSLFRKLPSTARLSALGTLFSVPSRPLMSYPTTGEDRVGLLLLLLSLHFARSLSRMTPSLITSSASSNISLTQPSSHHTTLWPERLEVSFSKWPLGPTAFFFDGKCSCHWFNVLSCRRSHKKVSGQHN